MSTPAGKPAKPSLIPKVPPPKCPHCGAVLDNVGLFSWGAVPPFQIFAVYCPKEECRVPLHMQIVPVISEQQGEELPPGGRIHLPS